MVLTTRDNDAIAAAQTYFEGRYDESLIDKVGPWVEFFFVSCVLQILPVLKMSDARGFPGPLAYRLDGINHRFSSGSPAAAAPALVFNPRRPSCSRKYRANTSNG